MRRWLLIAVLAAACGKSGDKPKDKPAPAADKSPTSAPTDEGELEPTPVEPEPKPDPPKPDPKRGPAPLPSADACVKDCIQRNQMKATSPENIEADCKSECSQK